MNEDEKREAMRNICFDKWYIVLMAKFFGERFYSGNSVFCSFRNKVYFLR